MAKPRKPGKGKNGLTQREKLFIRHYCATNNATQSAISAGYSKASARVTGSQLLAKPAVAAEISKFLGSALEKAGVTAQRVIDELGKLAFSNMLDFMRVDEAGLPRPDFSKLTREQAAALAEVTVEEFVDGRSDKRKVRRTKFKKHDKHAALDTLAKHFGLLVEKLDVNHTFTPVGSILDEIDKEGRQMRTIEALPGPEVG